MTIVDGEIEKISARLHVVEGYIRVLDDRQAFVALLASSEDRRAALDALVSDWQMSEIQAAHALDMQFGRSTKLSYAELIREAAQLREWIEQ